ncbi:MAG TPA: MG2 domain-containing protein [Polyangia bacterium]|jgi:hypothetical protein
MHARLASLGSVTCALAGGILLASCTPLPAPKMAAPASVPAADEALPPAPELAVVHYGPEGEIAKVAAITAVFNQPMVALSTRAEKVPLVVDPPLKGDLRWVSGDTLKLELTERPRHATEYTVRVPAGTASIAGRRLAREVVWRFATPRPALERATMPGVQVCGQELVRPGLVLELSFNQPVAPIEIERHLRLTVNGAPAELRAERSPKRYPDVIVVTPVTPFPHGAVVGWDLRAAYRGAEGPRAAAAGKRGEWGRARPLAAVLSCAEVGPPPEPGAAPAPPRTACWPMAPGVVVSLTAPVRVADFARAVAVTVTAKGRPPRRLGAAAWEPTSSCFAPGTKTPYAREFHLKDDLPLHARIDAVVPPGLEDLFGRTLAREARLELATQGYPPGLFLPRDGERGDDRRGDRADAESESEYVLEAPRRYTVKAVNVAQLVLTKAVLSGPELVRYLECNRQDDEKDPDAWEGPKDARTRRPCLLRLLHLLQKKVGLAVERRVVSVRAPADRVAPHELPLLPPGRQGGVVAFQLSSPQVVDSERRALTWERVVSFTALDVHARLSPHNLVAWVTALKDGRPVSGARVRVLDARGRVLSTGTTGPGGVALLPGFAGLPEAQKSNRVPRLYVLAERGSDLAYAEPHRHTGAAAGLTAQARRRDGETGTWEGAGPRLIGYAATERGIYRPGEPVHLYAIARQYVGGGHRPLGGAALTLRVLSPAGAVLLSTPVTTDEFGAALAHFDLPATAPLGGYRVRLTAGEVRLADHYFQVQQYRPPRFEVSLATPRREILAGESVDLKLGGRFFSGGPTARAPFVHVIARDPARLWLSQLTDYHIGADLSLGPTSPARGEASRANGRLDAAGAATLRLATKAGEAWHPLRYFVEAEVRDQTQATVAAEASVLVHPGDRYVAVKRLTPRGAPFDRVALQVLVVDTKGAPKGGAVTLTVHPRIRATMLVGGRREHVDRIDLDTVVEKRTVPVPAAGAGVTFQYPLVHEWVSALLTVTDAAGRVARTDLHLPRPAKPRPEEPARAPTPMHEPLEIHFDQECYQPGATAVITVRREPRLAAATLFVQRERTFAALPLDFAGGATAQARFPITEDHIGGLTVSVVAYPAGAPRDQGKPVLPLGRTERLCVDDSALALSVAVQPEQRVYRPGQPATVTLQVTDAKGHGREAAIVLMAVDESVLRLTRHRLHNPLRNLYHTPEDQITFDELRAYLMPLAIPVLHVDHAALGGFGLMGYGSGGGGFGAGYGRGAGVVAGRADGGVREPRPKTRRVFLTTALFRLVRTDAAGRARVTFPLPDNLTAFRLMAVAFDRGRRAGIGEASVTTDQALALVPALPRLARVGDRFGGGVVVYNNDVAAGEAQVTARATGAVLEGPVTKTLRVGKGLSEEARFAFRADQPGRATLRFEVRLGAERDVLEHDLPIELPRTPETRAVAGMTEDAARHEVEPLGDVQPGFGGLEVSLSSSALTGVDEGLDQLIKYPYGCMEQKSSQLLPMLAAITLGRRFALKLPGEPRELARRALGDILALQTANGGFAYWPGGRAAYPWLAGYALVVFHRAAQAGVPVDAENVRRAAGYLAGELRDRRGADLGSLGQQALMVYGLALHGYDVAEPAARLFAARGELPTFGRAMLLAALGLEARAARAPTPLPGARPARAQPAPVAGAAPPPTPRQMIGTLVREVGSALGFEGGYAFAAEAHGEQLAALMSSNDRTTAMVLLALLQARPEHPAVPRLAYYLVAGRRDASRRPVARFRNTQEAAWSLLALSDYAQVIEGTAPDYAATVSLGGTTLLSERFAGTGLGARAHAVPMTALQAAVGRASQQLLLRKQGKGRLYYAARLRFARTAADPAPVSRGFHVARRLLLLDDAGEVAPSPRPPRLGEVVRVVVTVKNAQTRRFVVVDDPLPAGVEAIDPALGTASRRITRPAGPARPRTRYDHRELRDDRVVHFVDELPPGEHVFEYLGRVVVPGAQAWPAARAEEMYGPEVYGTSGAEVFRAP